MIYFNDDEMKEYLKKLGYSFITRKFSEELHTFEIELAYKDVYVEESYLTSYHEKSIEKVFYKELKNKLLNHDLLGTFK